MKKIFTLLACTCLCLAFAGIALAGAHLTLSETDVQFGNLKEGRNISANKTIILSNTGDADLKITNVSTS